MPSHTTAAPSWLHADDPTQASNQTTQAPLMQRADEIPVDPTGDRATSSTMLERLVAEPEPEPVAVVQPPTARRSSIWRTIIPFMMFVLIVAAILYVLWSGVDIRTFFGGSSGPPIASTMPVFQRNRDLTIGVVRWQAHLEKLRPNAPVLVAYATDGAHGTELANLEAELVAQLQGRSHPLVLLATDPQGAILGRQRTTSSTGDAPILDLGYKPGGAVALARLANNFSGAFDRTADGRDLRSDAMTLRTFCGSSDGTAAGCSLAGVGMIVVVASDAGEARTWVEQVGSVVPNVPLVFAVPAESAPYVRPYLLSDQTTMLAGLTDAAALGASDSAVSALAGRQSDAVAVGSVVWGIVVLVGAIPAFLGGLVRRSKRGNLWQR